MKSPIKTTHNYRLRSVRKLRTVCRRCSQQFSAIELPALVSVRHLALAVSLSLLAVNPVFARTSDFTQAIDVKADRSEYDEKAGIQSLIGNVRITQGTMLILADRIEVELKDNKLSVINGDGSPIEFSQENDAGETVTGRCSSITYDAANGRLTLKGNATLTEPKQSLRSEQIIFDSITQTVVAEGGNSGQVSITLQPPEQKK